MCHSELRFVIVVSSPPIRGSRHEVTEGVVLCYKSLINTNIIRGTKDPSQPPLIGEELIVVIPIIHNHHTPINLF